MKTAAMGRGKAKDAYEQVAFGKVIYDNPQEYVQGIIMDNIKKLKYMMKQRKIVFGVSKEIEEILVCSLFTAWVPMAKLGI